MARRIFAIALMASLALSGCSVSAEPAAPRDPGAIRVAFYGDSYTLGTGASEQSLRWSTSICSERDWSEFNPSVNGLGFVNNRSTYGEGDLPDLIIADDPDIVFITMGLNDNFSFARAADEIEEQISEDFARLKTGLPDARFVVVEPFWYTDERPASVATIIGWVRDAAADIGADYIAGASHWIEGHPEFMATDGLHPNDAGYAHMAVLMEAELGKLGL
ncbi:MAG: SGNH/GDSL hydrolase family protein [Rhodoglobus sp.]|nr:SGNH/GDSL hydrolase family protein [Rhodoglobus sp.]